jgi:hypothetical protein
LDAIFPVFGFHFGLEALEKESFTPEAAPSVIADTGISSHSPHHESLSVSGWA